MGLQSQNQTSETILERIDAIIRELEMLRNIIITQTQPSDGEKLAHQLFGVLGQGTWTEYDLDLDWQRFEA